MTVAAKTPSVDYLENGVTVAFAVPFRFFSPSNIQASRIAVDGTVTPLVYGVDYNVLGGSDDNGGTLTLAAPGSAGGRLSIRRVTPRAQTMDWATADTFPAESHEGAADRAMLIDQEQDGSLAELFARALLVAVGRTAPGFEYEQMIDGDLLSFTSGKLKRVVREPFAGKFYAGDGTGRVVPASGTGNDPALRSDLASIIGATLVRYLDGTLEDKLSQSVCIEDFPGCDPTGATSSSAALALAFAASKSVVGKAGSTYLLDAATVMPAGSEFVGNFATLKVGPGATALRVSNPRCQIAGWQINGNGGLYVVHNTSDFCEFNDNFCSGNIGHYFFSSGATNVIAQRNRVDGLSATVEITTAIVAENCRGVTVSGNHFRNILIGWAIQLRNGTQNAVISGNECEQPIYDQTIVATNGQTVFNFTLGAVCPFKKAQVNGLPKSTGYTITGSGPNYTVTFDVGRTAGESIRLVGFRGAENIQVNVGCQHVAITGNLVDGTGDSGILTLGSHVAIVGNIVRNCGYVGIAVYGGVNHIVVNGNSVTNCAQHDDGLSSPDFPLLPSVFAGGILISSEDVSAVGNTIDNASGTMRYGIRVNKSDMALRSDGHAAIELGNNIFKGGYIDAKIFAPNDTTGQRINSVSVDGPIVRYPARVDLDQAWTNTPPDTAYFDFGGFGGSFALRDTSIKMGGVASLKTVPGEYMDCLVVGAGMFRNCAVEISFLAKNNSGSSYVEVYTNLGGLLFPLRVTITDTAWRQYTIPFLLTANLNDDMLIRAGGVTGFANIQHFDIIGRRL